MRALWTDINCMCDWNRSSDKKKNKRTNRKKMNQKKESQTMWSITLSLNRLPTPPTHCMKSSLFCFFLLCVCVVNFTILMSVMHSFTTHCCCCFFSSCVFLVRILFANANFFFNFIFNWLIFISFAILIYIFESNHLLAKFCFCIRFFFVAPSRSFSFNDEAYNCFLFSISLEEETKQLVTFFCCVHCISILLSDFFSCA